MKKYTYILILLVSVNFMNGQVSNEEFKNDLLSYLKIKENEKNIRINNFINNSNYKNKDSVKFFIQDIIDNKPVFKSSDNRLAALASKTNHLQSGGSLGLNLSGTGMTVGVWDGGWALTTHQEFVTNSVSRITNPDNEFGSTETNDHATHVTGTIASKGFNTSSKGMAPNVNVKSYDWTNDEVEMTNEITTNNLLLSNHSYGIPILNDSGVQNAPTWMMGCYNTEARDWDLICRNNPYYLPVLSAGNGGQHNYTGGFQDGIDKLTSNKNAKNALIIANANPTVHPLTGIISDLNINPSSSQGPTDDGRIKPDLAADGTNLFSTINTSNTSYDTYSGTSMASPAVTGSLLLLQELNNNLKSSYLKSATLRGLVCHTALDDTNFIGPDPFFGWGLLDTKYAAEVLINSNGQTPTTIVQENSLSNSNVFSTSVSVTTPKTLKVSICWTDLAGTARDNQLNSTLPALVNDLDLKVIKGSEIFYPWKLDTNSLLTQPAIKGVNNVDNIEIVEILNATGDYIIEVSHKGTLLNPQSYSFIVTGYDQNLSNKDFENNLFVSIYPNPVTDVLNFSLTENTIVNKISIIDISGKEILNTNAIINNSIDVSNLQAGVYFVKFTSDDKSTVKKFIKE